MHIFYLTAIVKPWFPGISYKYRDSNSSIKNVVLIMCKKSGNRTDTEGRISTHFFFD